MQTLGRIAGRGESVFETVSGKRFRGIIYPATDSSLPILTFNAPRHLLRTRVQEPIGAGEVFSDTIGRRFLIVDNDLRPHARTFALIQITDHATWTRSTSQAHPVTGQPMTGPVQDLGRIWIALEDFNGQREDGGLNVSIDRKRILTGASIQRGDMVSDRSVKRVASVQGIQVGEVE